MSERFEDMPPTSAAFPPRDLWLYNPMEQGMMEVVYDPYDLHMVDPQATMELFLTTVDMTGPRNPFLSPYADRHHIEHDEADHPHLPDALINPREYRTLASKQMLLGRVAHAWWHRVFRKPKGAKPEGMFYSIAAQRPVTDLASSMKFAGDLATNKAGEFDHGEFHRQVGYRLGFYSHLLEKLREVPREFQIVSTEGLAIDTVDDAIRVARMFRKYARPQAPLPIELYGAADIDIREAVAA